MTQTIALIIDAYRDLNSRKLFWITLLLSGLVMAAFALLGCSGSNLTFAKWHFDLSPLDPVTFYKMIFSYVVIGVWLSWAAIILALISTAGLFPDLITGGTIDLYLSKPISRLRLFLTKYATGLLFVGLQVAVFSAASFIVFGARAHEWRASIFLAIPIVLCMYSYLFGFCVLFGVWTRSTITALLLTILLWFTFWGLQKTDSYLQLREIQTRHRVERAKEIIREADEDMSHMGMAGVLSPHKFAASFNRKNAADSLPELESSHRTFQTMHNVTHGICTVIPKTSQTNDLLDRKLFKDEEITGIQTQHEERSQSQQTYGADNSNPFNDQDPQLLQQSGSELQGVVRTTSLWYVIGTSLACEAVVLALAAWIFCRRDY